MTGLDGLPGAAESRSDVHPSPFDLAALVCGYDPASPTAREDARHDARVWDLVERMRP